MVKYTPPLLSAVKSFKTPPRQSIGSPLYLSAKVLRSGASCTIDSFSPRLWTNSAPFELIATEPLVFNPVYATETLPSLSSFTTSLLSFCAISRPPSLVAIMPSALLPSTCQTSFHCAPAAMTPGMAVTVVSLGPAAAAAGAGPPFPFAPLPLPGGGGVLHVLIRSGYFG